MKETTVKVFTDENNQLHIEEIEKKDNQEIDAEFLETTSEIEAGVKSFFDHVEKSIKEAEEKTDIDNFVEWMRDNKNILITDLGDTDNVSIYIEEFENTLPTHCAVRLKTSLSNLYSDVSNLKKSVCYVSVGHRGLIDFGRLIGGNVLLLTISTDGKVAHPHIIQL